MTLFDLLFIALFLTAAVTLLVAAGSALLGRLAKAGRILRRLGLGVLAYMLLVVAASLATPRRFLGIGEDQCSDDWCIAVAGLAQAPAAGGTRYDVTFRLRSRARRVPQRERNVVVYLRDQAGRRYDAGEEESGPPFDVVLQPGETAATTRSFVLPAGAQDVGVVVSRGGVPFPSCCIIGDEGSLLHKRTVVRLE